MEPFLSKSGSKHKLLDVHESWGFGVHSIKAGGRQEEKTDAFSNSGL